MLAIEIDSDTHNYKIEEDLVRQKKLEMIGVRFLRYTDRDIKQNLEGVIKTIEQWIREHTPIPSQEGNI
jgi:very-short-patch-repair endonuclease